MPIQNNKQPGKIRRTFAGIRLIIKLLGVHDEYRIEMALSKLKRSRFGIYITNIFVFAVLAYVKLSALVTDKWNSLFTAKKRDFSHLWDEELPPRIVQTKPRVLIVGEMLNKQCRLYRVEQKRQQIEQLGWHCEVFSWQQLVEAEERLSYIDIVIFYRVVGTPKVLALIDYVRSLNKIAVFDVDDLVFDKALLEEKYSNESELLSDEVKQGNLYAADLYKIAIEHCDYAITTTQTLQSLLKDLVIQKQCFILPNALPLEAYQVAELPLAKDNDGKITLLYGSGSHTHDDDFQEVANALSTLMKQHSNLQIAVLGKLNLPSVLNDFADRIIKLPILDFASYLMFVRQADINIAPLQQDIFTDAKSEIKWLEAALFGVPTVMTPTQTYREIVEPGVTGFFAETQEQWFDHLNSLIQDPNLRLKIGESARQSALKNYGRDVMPAKLANVLDDIQADALSAGVLHKRLSTTKKSIMVVESYYSPQDVHMDPMMSVRRQVETLVAEHGDEYEILVVTADSFDTDKYVVNEYALNGIRVRAMGVGVESERINDYQNHRIKNTFKDVLEYFSPDIIHFHHLEALSGSVVEVARESLIPYVITIYDTSWWLTSGKYRVQTLKTSSSQLLEINPFSMIDDGLDVNDKIVRSRYLLEHLQKAQKVFSITEFQSQLLARNGIATTLLPEGVVNQTVVEYELENKSIAVIGDQLSSNNDFNEKFAKLSKELSNRVGKADLEFHQVDLSQLPSYKEEINHNGVRRVVRGSWLDQHDANKFIASMRVVILNPNWNSQSDLLIKQAQASGTLIVAPENDMYHFSIKPGNDGYFYSVKDLDALAAVLQNILSLDRSDTREDQATISENAQKLAIHYQDIHSSNGVQSL